MRALLTVFVKEFRENLRERRTLFSALVLGPLLCPLLFAGVLSVELERGAAQSERPVALALVHGERAPNLREFLHQYGVMAAPAGYDDAAARAAVRAHRAGRVLSISPDFGARLARGEPAPLTLYADASDLRAAPGTARVRELLAQYGALLARLRVAARGIDPLLLAPVAVQERDVSTAAARSGLALGALGYLVLLTMLTGGVYLAIDSTAGERERGSLEPLLTVPVRRELLIFGKILATCAYMTLSLVLTVGVLAVLLRFAGLEGEGLRVELGPWTALRVILCCLPLVPAGAAFMTVIAASTHSYREAQTWVGMTLLLPTVPLVLAGALGLRPRLASMAVPSLSQHFLIQGLLRDEPLPGRFLAVSVLATLALAALLVGLAGRLYRREGLLG